MRGLVSKERAILLEAEGASTLCNEGCASGLGRLLTKEEQEVFERLRERGLLRLFYCSHCPNVHYETTAEGRLALVADEASKKPV